MRGLLCVFLVVFTEAKEIVRPRPSNHQFLARKVDVYPPHFQMPVPFGHIYKEGFGDTSLGFKSPVDFLELSMREPKDYKEKIYLLNHANPANIHFYPDRIPYQHSGKQETYESERDRLIKELGLRDTPSSKNKTFAWFDITDLHSRNLVNAPPVRSRTTRQYEQLSTELTPKKGNMEPVGNVRFSELYTPPKKQTFTTCDEFGARSYFYPNDVINLEWIPFYVWSFEERFVAIPHKFIYVTKKFVSTYRTLYRDHKNIEWQRPKLLMKGKGEFLLIAADKRGSFHALPLVELPESFHELNVSLPYTTLRMKIEDPYLALMFCDEAYATIMAVASNVPPTDKEKRAEAASIGFQGPGAPVTRNLREEEAEKLYAKEMEEKMHKLSATAKPYFMTPMPEKFGQPEGGFQ